jgi:hypothetical protein
MCILFTLINVQINHWEYLDAVVKESLRLHYPGMLLQLCVYIYIHCIHHFNVIGFS